MDPVAIDISAGEDRRLWSDASTPEPRGPLRDDRTQEGPIRMVRQLILLYITAFFFLLFPLLCGVDVR